MLKPTKENTKKNNCRLTLIQLSTTLFALNLPGCAVVATQVASSIITHSADKIINNAYDAQLREEDKNRKLPNTHPDEYWLAIQNSGFNTITPQVQDLPAQESATIESEQPNIIIEPLPVVAKLATVEVWSLIIGIDKNKVFESARLGGAIHLPPQTEWVNWQVGLGELVVDNAEENITDNIDGNKQKLLKKQEITFIIPPQFGRITSGQQLVIELATKGEVNIARYTITKKSPS